MQAESPASAASTAAGRASEVSSRLQYLRNLLNAERNNNSNNNENMDRAIEALDREAREMSADSLAADLDRRRRDVRARLGGDALVSPSEVPPTTSLTSILRARRRAMPSSERLQRRRELLNQLASAEALDETTALIERPPPPIERSEVTNQEYLDEAQLNRENRWRAKRRKLDDGTYDEEPKTFSYGHKGQVVPGSLQMEIVSCDGGEYGEPSVGSSLPQHVLQDDPTIYCTKNNRCNMLLKHVGGMPISLTKITIQAPDSGYDAPIQEGMIFVSLTDENLLEKTSQYEVRYSPKSYRHHHRRLDPFERYRPSHEYLNSTRAPLSSIERTNHLREFQHTRQSDADAFLETALVPGFRVSSTYDNHSDDEDAPDVSISRPSVFPDFNVEQLFNAYTDHYRPRYADRYPVPPDQDSSDEDDDQDLEEGREIERRANHDIDVALAHQRQLVDRMRMVHGRDASGDWDRWTREYFRGELDHGPNRRDSTGRPEGRTDGTQQSIDSPTSTAPGEPSEPHRATLAPLRPAEPLAPHARFFIRRDKSSVSVKFDPPVAGRYILIKLWAPCPNANIEIQRIKAFGFGGPRFFPSREMR